jgi:hypothetical protein
MTGFDNYIPQKWLDGILTMSVTTHSKSTTKAAVRIGSWLKTGLLTSAVLAVLVGGVVEAIAPIGPNSTIEQVDQVIEGNSSPPLYAPVGYFEKLSAALLDSPRLAAQSITSDPPALV